MGWTLTGNSPNLCNWATGVVGGANPFPEDALLIGSFRAQMSHSVIGPPAEESDPEFAILRQGALSLFAGRLGDKGTTDATSVSGTESDRFGDPVVPGSPLVIPPGPPGLPETFRRIPGIDCVSICDPSEAAFRLVAPGVPDRYLPDGKRVVAGHLTFTYDLAPPIPLPAAGWRLLGGLAALGLVARRRPA